MVYNLYTVDWVGEGCGGWDTFDSMVVCASSERDARNWHPRGILMEQVDADDKHPTWIHPSKTHLLKVTHIGTAISGLEPGVIAASFNAG